MLTYHGLALLQEVVSSHVAEEKQRDREAPCLLFV